MNISVLTLFLQFSSVSKLCPTLWPHEPQHTRLPCPSPTQTHVHWVSNDIQTSHPLSSPSPLAFNFSQHQVFKWVSSSHQVAKVLELQLHHQPSHEYSGLISFRTDWSPCCPRDFQESSPAQFESINSSALSLLNGPTLTSTYDYWKNHSFDYRHLCQQSDIFAF